MSSGPAARAGIRTNDVIVEVDGVPVRTTSDLVRLVLTTYRVGDNVAVTVVRGFSQRTFLVTLQELS